MSPLVSVCIPSYNSAGHLGAAIESVLSQSLNDFELVVVDDCSSDDSLAVARRYKDHRLRVFSNETNLGAAGNWNRACGLASGRFVKLVCGDDLLYPTSLEQQVHAFDAGGPSIAMVAAKRDIISTDGQVMIAARGLLGMAGPVSGADAIHRAVRSGTNPFGEPAAVLMRASALRAAGPFRGTAEYMIDLDMWCRLLAQGDLYAVPNTQAAFRVQKQSWSCALAGRQASQARAWMADMRRRHPELISRRAVAEGSVRAWALERARRLAYRVTYRPRTDLYRAHGSPAELARQG
jgi:glycosyltransferase involved in cell wall biosynthesis